MRRFLIVLAVLLGLVIGLPALALAVLMFTGLPHIEIDLEPMLKKPAADLFDGKTVTIGGRLRRGESGGFDLLLDGRLLDWTYTSDVNITFGFLSAHATGDFELLCTPWRVRFDLTADSPFSWRAKAWMNETTFDTADPVIGRLVGRLPMTGVERLAFDGKVRFEAEAEREPKVGVPKWSALARLSDVSASALASGKTVSLTGLSVSGGATGIADHVDIRPLFPRIASVEAAGFSLTNVHASVRATEKALLLTEAGAGFCGGEVHLYSVFLDPGSLTAGATLFLEGIDAGEVMSHITSFRGDASGRLNGKASVFLKGGRELHIRDAYLHSIPGESGVVRVHDATAITDTLAAGGVTQAASDNLAKALGALDYTVLRLDLGREEDEEGLALTMRLEGSATSGSVTVPVSFAVTFHGDLEQLINTGFTAAVGRKDKP